MASNDNEGISYFEARDLMKTIAEECSTKEELAQDIHRRIYTIDMALIKEKEERTRLEQMLKQHRIGYTLTPHEAEQTSKAYGLLVARISDLHCEVEKAYREMFLEYRKINEMRKVYATYVYLTKKYEDQNLN